MEETLASDFTLFASLYRFFDEAVIGVILGGTVNIINLITPLVAAGFGIYMMLILSSYWRGIYDDHVTDFLLKMVGWGIVITMGLNIENYRLYVVPIVNELGEDLATVIGTNNNSASALDTMFSGLLNVVIKTMKAATLSTVFFAALMCISMSATGIVFMMIAAGYIIMAKLALGILIAIGPLFISAALFPATRKLFDAWVAQCLNYSLLMMLFSFAAQLQINMLSNLIPNEYTLSNFFIFTVSCAVMIFVSLNLPNLAAGLAGGVGISGMVGNVRHGLSLATKFGKYFKNYSK